MNAELLIIHLCRVRDIGSESWWGQASVLTRIVTAAEYICILLKLPSFVAPAAGKVRLMKRQEACEPPMRLVA